jgi:ABC-2 type transport system ATP-binding protein
MDSKSGYSSFIISGPCFPSRSPAVLPIKLNGKEVISVDKAAIETKGLTIRYKTGRTNRLAVDELTFRVMPGEIVGFIGPNGAGKTSTIKALLDFVPVPAGSCFIWGVPSGYPESRARVGYMPEISYYPKYLSLGEFLHACAAISDIPWRKRQSAVTSVVEQVGMSAHIDARLSSFSKGMLQQAGCAQALVHNPDVLILDEPMSGLDPIARMRMRKLLSELRNDGKTILFSSHELSEIELVADRVLLLNQGRSLYQGPISEIMGMRNNLEQAFLMLLGEEMQWAA